jgi:curved DNA-binding protein CbpA
VKRDGRRPSEPASPAAPPWLQRLGEAARYGTYFEVLGLARDASTSEVREAYRRLAADLDGLRPLCVGSAEIAAAVAEATQVAEDAFAVLSDPDLRLAYRRGLDG